MDTTAPARRGATMFHVLDAGAAGGVLAAAVVSVWMPTPLTERAASVVTVLVLAGVACAAARHLADRALDLRIGPVLAAALAVLALGWWMALNARSAYGPLGVFRATDPPAPRLPGAIDRATADALLAQVTAAVMTGLVLRDLMSRRRWVAPVLVGTIAANGAAISLIGALDRFSIGPFAFDDVRFGGIHFATFGYHANAAAFLNASLPAGILGAALAWRHGRLVAARWFIGATVLMLVGCATHASKAGPPITALVFVVSGSLALRLRPGRTLPVRRARLATAGVTAVGLSIAMTGVWLTASRWAEVPDSLNRENGRLLMWRAALRGWDRSPWYGIGPGNLKLVVPQIARDELPELLSKWVVEPYVPGSPVGIYHFTTSDPIQILAEWGIVGAVLWAIVLGGPVLRPWFTPRLGHEQRIVRGIGTVAVIGVYLHAAIDFPLHVYSVQLVTASWLAILGSLVVGDPRDEAAGG